MLLFWQMIERARESRIECVRTVASLNRDDSSPAQDSAHSLVHTLTGDQINLIEFGLQVEARGVSKRLVHESTISTAAGYTQTVKSNLA